MHTLDTMGVVEKFEGQRGELVLYSSALSTVFTASGLQIQGHETSKTMTHQQDWVILAANGMHILHGFYL